MLSVDDLIHQIELQVGVRSIGRYARQGNARELYATITNAIRKGALPHLRSVDALRRMARLSLGSVYLTLGVNLDHMAGLRAQLNNKRTRPAPSRTFLAGTPVTLPARIADVKRLAGITPLSQIVTSWCRQPISNLGSWRNRVCLYAQIGLQDGMSYPGIPPGAFVQVDAASTAIQGISDTNYYFVRHLYGYSCCRCAVEKGTISLLPSSTRYPQLDFPHPGVVQILGRVRAFCARIDSISSPSSTSLRQLKSRREPMKHTPAELAEHPPGGQELLLNQRLCLGIPYDELEPAIALVRSSSPELARFHISNGHAHKIEHVEGFVPTISTLFPLTAYYALDYSDVLAAYGFDVDDSNTIDLSVKEAKLTMSELAMAVGAAPSRSNFASHVLDHWLEWPALLSQLGPDFSSSKIFFVSGKNGLEPILKQCSFVLVDDSQTTILDGNQQMGTDALSDWERPLYLFYLRERGFVAGYGAREGKNIYIIPHPQASDRRRSSFLSPDGGEVIGRIVGVATLL